MHIVAGPVTCRQGPERRHPGGDRLPDGWVPQQYPPPL